MFECKKSYELVIDQSNYFAFEIDDIEKRQAMSNLTAAYSQDAAYQLRDLTDQYLAGLMAAGAKSKLDPLSGATATKFRIATYESTNEALMA